MLKKLIGTKASNGRSKANKGFTLIELVAVMVLLGVMALGIGGFISLSTQTYLNVSERDELIASARFAIERLNRELRNAVPNSIRVKNVGSTECIEFIPIKASTVYTQLPLSPEEADDVITVIPFLNESGTDFTCSFFCLDVVSVYGLNQNELYVDTSATSGKAFTLKSVDKSAVTLWDLKLKKNVLFDRGSPTKRLYISKNPVTYCVDDGNLERYTGYNISDASYIIPAAFPILMAENILYSGTSFQVVPATLQRNGAVQLNLNFQQNDENIVFNQEIQISNVP